MNKFMCTAVNVGITTISILTACYICWNAFRFSKEKRTLYELYGHIPKVVIEYDENR